MRRGAFAPRFFLSIARGQVIRNSARLQVVEAGFCRSFWGSLSWCVVLCCKYSKALLQNITIYRKRLFDVVNSY